MPHTKLQEHVVSCLKVRVCVCARVRACVRVRVCVSTSPAHSGRVITCLKTLRLPGVMFKSCVNHLCTSPTVTVRPSSLCECECDYPVCGGQPNACQSEFPEYTSITQMFFSCFNRNKSGRVRKLNAQKKKCVCIYIYIYTI